MKKHIALFAAISFLFTSCEVDESLNIDKKNPTEVPASGLFTNALKNLGNRMNSCSVNENVFRLYSQYWAQTTYPDESQYNMIGRSIPEGLWNNMYRDVIQDIKGAKSLTDETETAKLAILEFIEIYAYAVLVDTFGDIPYSEALNPLNPTPKYDDAKTIYKDLISRLDDVIADLSSGTGFVASQDIAYSGTVSQWKKAANSLKLRMALRTADVTDIDSETMAEEAFTSGVIVANADNFGINYLSTAPNTNPLWVDLVQSGRNDFVGSNILVGKLEELNDPRIATYLAKVNGAYKGGVYGTANSASANSAISDVFKAPDLKGDLITAAEVHFLLAEAAERGYSVGGTAKDYYESAIAQSMMEWGQEDGTEAYLAQADVAYDSAAGDWKAKIGTQKWIALFNNGYEGWTTWRLLDIDVLVAPEDPNDDTKTLDIPTRFIYPISEATLNGASLDAAAANLTGGDKKTSKIFWDKN
ncbi:MAG: SusD/RagB family nutrient-binding outer membrane lipoprotein [Flavicella sp.]